MTIDHFNTQVSPPSQRLSRQIVYDPDPLIQENLGSVLPGSLCSQLQQHAACDGLLAPLAGGHSAVWTVHVSMSRFMPSISCMQTLSLSLSISLSHLLTHSYTESSLFLTLSPPLHFLLTACRKHCTAFWTPWTVWPSLLSAGTLISHYETIAPLSHAPSFLQPHPEPQPCLAIPNRMFCLPSPVLGLFLTATQSRLIARHSHGGHACTVCQPRAGTG